MQFFGATNAISCHSRTFNACPGIHLTSQEKQMILQTLKRPSRVLTKGLPRKSVNENDFFVLITSHVNAFFKPRRNNKVKIDGSLLYHICVCGPKEINCPHANSAALTVKQTVLQMHCKPKKKREKKNVVPVTHSYFFLSLSLSC